MGLQSDIQSDLGDAFDTDLADAIKSIVLIKESSSTYAPATGSTASTEVEYATRGVIYGYREVEIFNTAIEPTDIRIIVLQNELAAIPEIDDYIEWNSDRYKVMRVEQDPAGIQWSLRCRQ